MKIVFVSNYYNHHQSPIATEFFRLSKGNFNFISTLEVPDERVALGYQKENFPDFVILAYKSDKEKQQSIALIDNADVVIIGSAPDAYVRHRLRQGKLTFRCHERLYKTPLNPKQVWKVKIKHYFKHKQYENLYLLCCSAYTAADYAKTQCFLGKAYKWGYFPHVNRYSDVDSLISKKKKASILWCGRMIEYKHPEYAIKVAKALKKQGYSFSMSIIGTGVLEEELRTMIDNENLTQYVQLLGTMDPSDVRMHMEQSEIFLFTSDRGEGWGAVLNESMNSACAVVAGQTIGAVPYLVQDGINGVVYSDSNVEMLVEKVKFLLDSDQQRLAIQKAAYETMTGMWNADIAASRFLKLAEQLLLGNPTSTFEDGPCSIAPILFD